MKKFNETYKNTKLDLSKFDKEIQEKFANLDGKQITECCSCNCCPCSDPCPSDVCGCNCSSIPSFPIKFFNEYEIVNKILTDLKVIDMYDIHTQFTNGNFYSNDVRVILENAPLFFNEQVIMTAKGDQIMLDVSPAIKDSKIISGLVKTLTKKYGMTTPLVLCRIDGSANIYLIKNTGTNGKEGSIKNSLKEIYDLLGQIETMTEVSSAWCPNISIDNADDVYSFIIAISLDKVFVLNTIKTETTNQ